MAPRTIYELVELLGSYHQRRHDSYLQLAATGTDDRVCILLHRPLGETARWLRRVVQGWLNYHAVPGNSRQIGRPRRRGDSSLVACHPSPQPTWSLPLDVGTNAPLGASSFTASAHRPSLS